MRKRAEWAQAEQLGRGGVPPLRPARWSATERPVVLKRLHISKPPRILPRGAHPLIAMIASSGLLLFIHIASEMSEGEANGPDRAILLMLRTPGHLERPIGPAWLLQSAIDLSALGGFTILWMLSAAVTGYLLIARRWAAAAIFAAAMIGASVINAVVKIGYHRARPEVVPHLAVVSNASFPSGHAMLSAATYLTIGAMLAQIQPRASARIYILTIAVVLAILVGLTRLYLGVHWPSDVLAGWCLGSAWALAFWTLTRWVETHPLKAG
jgi:undecaprenyl-diphosphatase